MAELESLEAVIKTLTPRVAQLISNRNHAHPSNLLLSDAEIAIIKSLLRSKSPLPKHIRLPKAMTLLAQAEHSAEVVALLGSVLGRRSLDPISRAVAASLLNRMPREEAELVLMANIGAEDPLVLSHVIQSLGCIGHAQALTHLESIGAPREPYVQKQLALSKALIMHRLNLPGDPLPFREGEKRTPQPGDELLGVSFHRMPVASVQKCRQHLRGCTYEIAPSDTLGLEFIAGNARWILFCNREMEAAGFPHTLLMRKWIFGLFTIENKRARSLNTQHIVLTKPSEKGVDIQVVRTDGEVYYTGRASGAGDTITFSLRDVNRPGTAPTTFEGRLSPGGVAFDTRVAFSKRVGKRTTDAVAI